MAVAAQEIDQPEHVAIAFVADDDRPAPALDQADAAQDQGPHDALAEFRLATNTALSPSGGIAIALAVGQRLPSTSAGRLTAGPVRP
jgi:hypothetical protein